MQDEGSHDEDAGYNLHHPEHEHDARGTHAATPSQLYKQRRQHLQIQTLASLVARE